jgi:ribonuclease BN (tRNA processing enzyme)
MSAACLAAGRAPARWLGGLLFLLLLPRLALPACGGDGVWLQVLGSGGPELDDGRTSSAYLVWHEGKARVLVDLGSGGMARFEQAGARVTDLDTVLLSHFHVDHSTDLAALVKGSWFTQRRRDLPLYGPSGNERMLGAEDFVQALLGAEGAWRYLSGYLDGQEDYRLSVTEVTATGSAQSTFGLGADLAAAAAPVHHGPVPALAWRVRVADAVVAFSGDTSGRNGTLPALAHGADILVAHNAIPEAASATARSLHMPPSVIGRIAGEAEVGQLVLSHRMKRSLGHEEETLALIRKSYDGPVHFANDLQCIRVRNGGIQPDDEVGSQHPPPS